MRLCGFVWLALIVTCCTVLAESENKPREKRTIHFLLLQFADALGYNLQPKPVPNPIRVATTRAPPPPPPPSTPRPLRPVAQAKKDTVPPKNGNPPGLARFNFIVAPFTKFSGPAFFPPLPLPQPAPTTRSMAPPPPPPPTKAPPPPPTKPGPSKIAIPFTTMSQPPPATDPPTTAAALIETTTMEAETQPPPEAKADNGADSDETFQEFPGFNGDYPQYWGSGVMMAGQPGQSYRSAFTADESGQQQYNENGIDSGSNDFERSFFAEPYQPYQEQPFVAGQRAPRTPFGAPAATSSSHSSVKMHDSNFNYVTYHGKRSVPTVGHVSTPLHSNGHQMQYFGKHSFMVHHKK